jgi:4-carboxymuconolactone decarboxylase
MSKTMSTMVLTGLIAAALITANTGAGAQAEQAGGGNMQTTQPNVERRRLSPDDVRKVAPALEAYTQERLYGEVWKRPGLTPRDRSIVTISALIARNQAPALTYYFSQALEHGVKPREISEIINAPGVLLGLGECLCRRRPGQGCVR